MRFLRVNGHEMAYVEEGSGGPLLLIHGALADLRFWAPLMGAFAPVPHGRGEPAPPLARALGRRWR